MIEISIQQTANQEFTVNIDNDAYFIRLKTFKGTTLCDITRNDVEIVSGVRCVPNQAIIPYKYLLSTGNFCFICLGEEYPHYSKFGVSQNLYFLSSEELEELYG